MPNENEEFEFRLRAEQEAKASQPTAAAPAKQSDAVARDRQAQKDFESAPISQAISKVGQWANAPAQQSKTPVKDVLGAAAIGSTIGGAALIAGGLVTGGATVPEGLMLIGGGGAAAGATEALGQMADAMHMKNWASEGVRMVAAPVASFGNSVIAGSAKLGMHLLGKVGVGGGIISSIAKNFIGEESESVTAKVAAAVNKARTESGGQKSMADAHKVVSAALDAEKQQAEAHAKSLVEAAEAEAKKIEARSPEVAQGIRDRARETAKQMTEQADAIYKEAQRKQALLMQKSNQIKTEQAGNLEKVGSRTIVEDGKPRAATVSDEGSIMQKSAVGTHSQLVGEMKKVDAVNRQAKLDVVKAKEAQGIFPEDTKAFKALYKRLADRIKTGAATHTSEVAQIDMVKNALNGNQIPVAWAKAGDEITNAAGQKIIAKGGEPTKFQRVASKEEAIDYLRRKAGDAANPNKEVEGFSALGVEANKKLYRELSEVQREYVGPEVWDKLQKDYHLAKKSIDKRFGSGAADKAIDINRATEELAADPASISKQVFSTKASVENMVKAAGPESVSKAASMKIARELEGLSSSEVKDYIKKNGDWIRAVPDKTLAARLNEYQTGLAKSESRTSRLENAASEFEKKGARTAQMRVKEAMGVSESSAREASEKTSALAAEAEAKRASGQQAAAKVTQDSQARANQILTSDTPAESVVKMINDNPVGRLKEISKLLANSPEGKKAFEQGVHAALMKHNSTTIKDLWVNKLGPALAETKMMSPAKMREIESQIADIERAYGRATPRANNAIKKFILQTVGAYGASLAVQGTSYAKKDAEQRAREAMQ